MRAIVVAGGAFALAAAFGMGIVVGRFVLDQPGAQVPPPATALPGLGGVDDPLGDPGALLEGDPSLIAPPPVPPRPLPPATAPGTALALPPGTDMARTESQAAQMAGACQVRVAKQMPVRDFAQPGQVVAEAAGDTCGAALVRLTLRGQTGDVLYTLAAPASDFGLTGEATPDQLRAALDAALPNSARRASAYEAWGAGSAGPAGTEFDQAGYEAVRAANAPVICLKVPSAPSRCIAADAATGQMRVFSRG
jgi:hypothetical protein